MMKMGNLVAETYGLNKDLLLTADFSAHINVAGSKYIGLQ